MMPLRPHRCWSGTQKAQVSRHHRHRMGRRHRSAQRRPQPHCRDCRAAGALDPPALVAFRRRRRHAQRHLHQLRRRWRPASCGGPRARVHASTSWQVARGGWPAAAVRPSLSSVTCRLAPPTPSPSSTTTSTTGPAGPGRCRRIWLPVHCCPEPSLAPPVEVARLCA